MDSLTSIVPLPSVAYIRAAKKFMLDVELRPEHAVAILDQWSYKGQRKVRESRVRTYVHEMTSGDWTYSTEMHVGVLPDGSTHLLNGYHRLHALARLPSDTEYRLPVTLIVRFFETPEELAGYYSVIDIGGVRTTNDALAAHGLAEEWGVLTETIKAAGYAAPMILNNFTGGRSNSLGGYRGRSVPAKVSLLREWEEEIVLSEMVTRQTPSEMRKKLWRQAVYSVMLMTLRYAREMALEFWTKVGTGEDLRLGMPAMTLRNFLLATNTRKTAEHIYARYVANCWNAYVEGRMMYRVGVQLDGLADPIVIERTPYSQSARKKARQARLAAEATRGKQRVRLKIGQKDEETVSEVPSEPGVLGPVRVLLEENYGPQPVRDRMVEAGQLGEQGGTRPE